MKMTQHKPGTPSWVDLASPDVEATKAFYTGLFGWQAYTVPDPGAGGDTNLRKGGGSVAAIGPGQGGGRPPGWNWCAATADPHQAAPRGRAARRESLPAPCRGPVSPPVTA